MAAPIALVFLPAASVGCDDKVGVDPLAKDRAALDRIVTADLELDRALKRADDLSAKGDDAAAADALEKRALPRATAALAEARAATTTSAWANDRRAEWLAIAADRAHEIPRYAAALRGDDVSEKLAALEAQAAIQRRAMSAAASVKAGPDGGAGAR